MSEQLLKEFVEKIINPNKSLLSVLSESMESGYGEYFNLFFGHGKDEAKGKQHFDCGRGEVALAIYLLQMSAADLNDIWQGRPELWGNHENQIFGYGTVEIDSAQLELGGGETPSEPPVTISAAESIVGGPGRNFDIFISTKNVKYAQNLLRKEVPELFKDLQIRPRALGKWEVKEIGKAGKEIRAGAKSQQFINRQPEILHLMSALDLCINYKESAKESFRGGPKPEWEIIKSLVSSGKIDVNKEVIDCIDKQIFDTDIDKYVTELPKQRLNNLVIAIMCLGKLASELKNFDEQNLSLDEAEQLSLDLPTDETITNIEKHAIQQFIGFFVTGGRDGLANFNKILTNTEHYKNYFKTINASKILGMGEDIKLAIVQSPNKLRIFDKQEADEELELVGITQAGRAKVKIPGFTDEEGVYVGGED